MGQVTVQCDVLPRVDIHELTHLVQLFSGWSARHVKQTDCLLTDETISPVERLVVNAEVGFREHVPAYYCSLTGQDWINARHGL
ncbi:hypothetical protein CUU62_10000 [Pseudomonas sp. WP001]|nr:hypothetical protein CUU62_10000 [Pseudomonas sp. WP001]